MASFCKEHVVTNAFETYMYLLHDRALSHIMLLKSNEYGKRLTKAITIDVLRKFYERLHEKYSGGAAPVETRVIEESIRWLRVHI